MDKITFLTEMMRWALIYPDVLDKCPKAEREWENAPPRIKEAIERQYGLYVPPPTPNRVYRAMAPDPYNPSY